MTEEELLRLSFAQIYRLFEGYRIKEENEWKRARLVAYETWRKGAKTAPDINTYMPIGASRTKEMTVEELDDIWQKYGKLKSRKMRRHEHN